MSTKLESKDIAQILAEADELIIRINSDIIKEIEAEHRLHFEVRAQQLQEIKAKVQAQLEKNNGWHIGSGAEGMHEAFQEIAKAVQDLKKYLSRFRSNAIE